MEEKHHNPNSHTYLRLDTSHSWSELPLDLLSLVFERLSFASFQRAKTVCSSWYSASRQCVPKNHIPWLILFPKEKDNNKNNNNCCMLFNPKEKDKLYKRQDLGFEFAKNVCIATYGSWLFMRDPRYNLYIMNIFTRERIDLPSMESQLGMVKVERTIDDGFRISDDYSVGRYKDMDIRTPVFWIDEKTKDYVVFWGLGRWSLVYSKKGDNLWNQIPEISYGYGMVYKDQKLYFFSYSGIFKIFNFSGEIPREIFQCGDVFQEGFRFGNKKFVVTITGDVLVQRLIRGQSFRIHKICYSSGSFEKHEQVDSLGEEAVFWDLGITMLANEVEGINRNSIYFSSIDNKNPKYLFFFNLETRKTEQLYKFDFDSSLLEMSSRWFLPSFTHA